MVKVAVKRVDLCTDLGELSTSKRQVTRSDLLLSFDRRPVSQRKSVYMVETYFSRSATYFFRLVWITSFGSWGLTSVRPTFRGLSSFLVSSRHVCSPRLLCCRVLTFYDRFHPPVVSSPQNI